MHLLVGQPYPLTAHRRRRIGLPQLGLFATWSRERPNPIGLAVVELLQRKRNVLIVKALDPYDGSPVLGGKRYGHCDLVNTGLREPKWWKGIS